MLLFFGTMVLRIIPVLGSIASVVVLLYFIAFSSRLFSNVVGGFQLRRRGNPLPDVLAAGAQPFCLILRPFGTDGFVQLRSQGLFHPSPYRTLESIVAENVATYLRLRTVAVRDPKQWLQPPGPEPIEAGADWQAAVGALVDRAEAIVFVLTPQRGATAAVTWELEQVLARADSKGLIVLMPRLGLFARKRRDELVRTMCRRLGHHPQGQPEDLLAICRLHGETKGLDVDYLPGHGEVATFDAILAELLPGLARTGPGDWNQGADRRRPVLRIDVPMDDPLDGGAATEPYLSALEAAFAPVGPLVTVTAATEEDEQRIRDAAADAQLVLLAPSASPACLDLLRAFTEDLDPRRLLLDLWGVRQKGGRGRRAFAAFREQARAFLPHALPAGATPRMVGFDADWVPHPLRPKRGFWAALRTRLGNDSGRDQAEVAATLRAHGPTNDVRCASPGAVGHGASALGCVGLVFALCVIAIPPLLFVGSFELGRLIGVLP